jgi:uncharacterized membrane protein required for colicin V production
MDWSLIIFVVVVIYFAFRGYRKGLFRSIARILSLVAGYIAAILYSGQLAAILESVTPLRGMVSFISASLLLFFGAGIVVSILFWLIAKLLLDTDTVSTPSALGGAALGTAFGVIAAIAIVWTFAFVRDMRPAAVTTEVTTSSPPSKIEDFAGRAASKAVNTAMSLGSVSPEVTSLSSALIEAPADMAQLTQRLASSKDLDLLLNDPQGQAILNHGDVDALQKLPAFQQLVTNPDMLALAKSAGMLDESANTQTMEADLARQMVDIWGKTQRVQNDQRVQEILSDPEFQQKIQSGNPLDLLSNARLLELADIIFAEGATPESAAGKQAGGTEPVNETGKKGTLIYSWTDKDGRVHYSDSSNKP